MAEGAIIKSYRLRGMSYMSLSLPYLVMAIAVAVITLVTTAVLFKGQKMVLGSLVVVVGCLVVFSIQHVGIKYGRYGLMILFGKLIQPKVLTNTNPNIFKMRIDDKK